MSEVLKIQTELARGEGSHLVMSTERERPITFIPFHMIVQSLPNSQNAALTD